MPKYLLITVGGSAPPIIASLLHWQPDEVCFLVTEESEKSLEEIKSACAGVPAFLQPGAVRQRLLLDPQDLNSSMEDMLEMTHALRVWKSAAPDANRLIVDITGGTKIMSAALAVVAQHWPCEFSYVGGSTRDKNGVGIVVDGREHVIICTNPADVLGRHVLEEALTLFNDQGAYAAAASRLTGALQRMRAPARKQEFSALAALFDAYAAWHRFDHKDAARYFQSDFPKAENHLKAILGPSVFEDNRLRWKRTTTFLTELLTRPAPNELLISDLLANADRCARFGFFDDAVARLYRATEAYAQYRLGTYQFPDTSKMPVAQLPSIFTKFSNLRPNNGTVKMGLQECYQLLAALQDEAGQRFIALDLEGEQSALTARNSSLLAHGFIPVGEKVFKSLRRKIADLTLLDAGSQPVFPILR